MSKEKNPKVKNVRVIHYLNYLIFFGTLTFFSASCAKEEKGDEINKINRLKDKKPKDHQKPLTKIMNFGRPWMTPLKMVGQLKN